MNGKSQQSRHPLIKGILDKLAANKDALPQLMEMVDKALDAGAFNNIPQEDVDVLIRTIFDDSATMVEEGFVFDHHDPNYLVNVAEYEDAKKAKALAAQLDEKEEQEALAAKRAAEEAEERERLAEEARIAEEAARKAAAVAPVPDSLLELYEFAGVEVPEPEEEDDEDSESESDEDDVPEVMESTILEFPVGTDPKIIADTIAEVAARGFKVRSRQYN